MRLATKVLLGAALAVVASAALGRFGMAAREPDVAPPEPVDPGTSLVETRSGRTHVLDLGTGPTLLLTHGSGRGVADWQEGLAERLAERHRVVAFDNYGFGRSERAHGWRYGNALWARQAVDVLDALGIDDFVVAGHSAGGVVAASIAADHPERVRGAVFMGHGIAMDPAQIVPFFPGLGELWASRIAIFGDAFSARHRERQEAAYRVRGTRAALLTFIRRQYTVDGIRLLRGTYEDIAVPVLQLHGSEDRSIPLAAARALGERLADTRFVAIDGAGHDIHVEAQERVAREIDAFVGELPLED